MKKKFWVILSCTCTIIVLACALSLSVLATNSVTEIEAQNDIAVPITNPQGDEIVSGKCGDNLIWALNVTTGSMRIYGAGPMSFDYEAPWRQYAIYVRELVIDEGVTSIAPSAFYGCYALNLVTIGKDVTNIGFGAFSGCEAIAEVYNASSLNITTHKNENNTNHGFLGYWAKSIIISQSSSKVLRKDGFVFWKNAYGEYELLHYAGRDTDITLPDAPIGEQQTYSIADFAFYYEHDLTSITIPECVTKIGKNAIFDCHGLTRLYIPDSVRTMSMNSVGYCNNLLWVRLGSGLTNLGGVYAGSVRPPFSNCKSLIEVCNDSRFEIVAGTYSQDTGITAEFVYSSESGESKLTFDGDFIYCDRDGVCTLIKYTGNASEIIIPDCVVNIAEKAFNTIDSIERVVIPASVQNIAINAFYDCHNITEIVAPFTATCRGEAGSLWNVFRKSVDNLKKFTLTEGTSIPDGAFSGCSSLEEVIFPSDITYIGISAFSDCTSLKSFTVPDSVVEIGISAFSGCTSLESLSVPFIGRYNMGHSSAYLGYFFGANSYSENGKEVPSSLEKVTLTNTTVIFENAFYNCSDIITVVLPEGLESIGANAFKGCRSLFEIFNLSDLVLEVGVPHESCITDNALAVCLETNAPTGIYRVDGFVFYRNISTGIYTLLRYKGESSEVIFPASIYDSSYTVEAIYPYAFEGRTDITSIAIPHGVKEIGEYAFSGCTSLETLTLPTTVEKFHYSSIDKCSSLLFNKYSGANYLGNPSFPYHILVSVPSRDITEFNVHNATKIILKYAFNNATGIETLTIPAEIGYIESFAFSSYMQVKNLTAPTNVLPFIPKSSLVTVYVNGGTELPEKAFYEAKLLEKVTLHSDISVIGKSAFFGCQSLKSIDLSDIYRIDEGAFEKCTALESVTFYHGTAISESCFKNCSSLIFVSLNDGIRTSGKDAFLGCSSLSEVYVNDIMSIIGIDFINEYANPIYYAKSLYVDGEKITELEIPYGNVTIKPYAFVNLDITALSIPSDAVIDETSFVGCNSIQKLSVPADYLQFIPKFAIEEINIVSGEVIPTGAFATNNPLTKVTLAESVKTISERAFSSCSYIKDLYIMSDIVSFGKNAFYSATVENLYVTSVECWFNMSFDGEYANPIRGAKLFTFNGTLIDHISIPESVTEVAAMTFIGCQSIKSVYIDSADTVIGNAAFTNVPIEELKVHISQLSYFSGCMSTLKKVELLSGEVLPGGAFYGASSLENVTLCDSLKEIGDAAFGECYALKSIEIPESVTSLGKEIFYYCSALESATLPSSLTFIPEGTFLECSALVSVKIPDGVTEIRKNAFYRCVSLPTINYSGSALTTIGEYAFYDCDALTEIILPESVFAVGDSAFNNCSSVTTIYIPKTVTSFAPSAIGKCTNLETLTCSTDHLDYPYYPNLETVTFNGGIILGSSIFSSCEKVANVTLPDTLTTISSSAFSGCKNLVSVNIPASVTEIGSDAFKGCDSLESIYAESLEAWVSIDFDSPEANPLKYAENLYLGGALCTDLIIPEEITMIGEYVFTGFKSLKSVSLHGNMEIGYDAFYMCSNLETVNIASISDWLTISFVSHSSNPICYSGVLYAGGELLVDLVIPDGTEQINSYAFAGITSVKTVYVPKSVTTFGYSLFAESSNIKEIICCSDNYSTFVNSLGYGVSVKITNHCYEFIASEDTHHLLCQKCASETTPTQHTWLYDPIEKLSPTHTTDGYAIYICECGQTNKQILDALGHDFYIQTEYIAPTHTEEGRYVYSCDCGETTTVPIDKLEEHQFDSGTVTLDPTHTEVGQIVYACACGESYTEDIPTVPDHDFGDWLTTDSEYHCRTCSCGESEIGAHFFDGDLDAECDACGYTREIETEPVTESNSETATFTEDVTETPTEKPTQSPSAPSEPSGSDKAPDTSGGGCSSSFGGTSAVIALMSAAALLFCRKKKED